MGSKTLTGRGLSMQSTPLGPWEVGGSAGPAGAGLQGRYCSVADPNRIRCDQGRKGVKMRDRTHYVSGLWYLVSSRGGALRFGEVVVGSVDKCRGNSLSPRTTHAQGMIGS